MAGSRFPIADANRAAKGRRWMRALQRQIADVWMATIETDTTLCQCHGLVAEDEVVAISTAFAVTAVRVLDLEVFQREYELAYLATKASERRGHVVDGLVLIRNAEIHLPVILDPDPDRVLSLGQLFRVLPKWKPYAELPTELQGNTLTRPRCHAAYRSVVEGESVIETLLDALAWFLECDEALACRDDAGELKYFPLPELWQHDYERRHPEWQRRAEFEAQLRVEATKHTPGGSLRAIRHRLTDDVGNTVAYCGYTSTISGGSMCTEFPDQIERDVTAGYPYFIEDGRNSGRRVWIPQESPS